MKITIIGANGRMGKKLCKYCDLSNIEYIAVDKHNRQDLLNKNLDAVIDFSLAQCLQQNLEFAKTNNIPIVIATTAHTDAQKQLIKQTSKTIPIFLASNLSVQFALFKNLIKNLSTLKSCDFVLQEMHHVHKKDKPSGSAISLITELNKLKIKPKVYSVRAGEEVGTHTLTIFSKHENLTICHNVKDRQVFCEGAIKACEFLLTKKAGLYTMEDLINDCK